MQKKTIFIIALLVIIVGLAIYPRLTRTQEAVSVSEVSASPTKFLGKLTISGIAGEIVPEEGVILMVDAGGCCNIPVLVPFTAEQDVYKINRLYQGVLPAEGSTIIVSGTLKQEPGYFDFVIEQVEQEGQIIISKSM
jgi:hypothetical protein